MPDETADIKQGQSTDRSDDARKIMELAGAWTGLETRWQNFRRHQIRNFEYVAGNMLDEAVRAQLIKDKRPIFEFKTLEPVVLFIAGKLKRDGTKMKAVPIHRGAEDSAYLHTVVTNDWAMEQCSGYNEMARAGLDAYIGGLGFTQNHWTDRGDPEGTWDTARLDPTSVMYDPSCRQPISQKDMRFITWSAMYTADEIIEIYKKYLDEDTIKKIRAEAERQEGPAHGKWGIKSWFERFWNSSFGFLAKDEDAKRRKALITNFTDAENGLYRVVEWHDKRTTVKHMMYSPVTRESEEVPEDKLDDGEYMGLLIARFPGGEIETVSEELNYLTVVAPGLLVDHVILEMPYVVQKKGFSIKVVPALDFHPDAVRVQSGIGSLIAPADLFNQKSMTMMEMVMDSVNPPIDAEEGSIDAQREDDWRAKTRGLLRFYVKGRAKPEPRQFQAGAIQAVQGLMELGQELEEKLSGVSPNSRGYAETSKESGTLFNQRKAQTEVMISHFFDNMQEFMKYSFNYCDRSLQSFLTFEREIRIFGDSDDPQWITLNQKTLEGVKNDYTQGEYDFKPDQSSLGETARKENLALVMQIAELVKDFPDVLLMFLAEAMKFIDIPNAKKFASYLDQKVQMIQQQQQDQFQAAQAQQKLAVIHGALEARQKSQQPPPQLEAAQPGRQAA